MVGVCSAFGVSALRGCLACSTFGRGLLYFYVCSALAPVRGLLYFCAVSPLLLGGLVCGGVRSSAALLLLATCGLLRRAGQSVWPVSRQRLGPKRASQIWMQNRAMCSASASFSRISRNQ